MPLESHWNRATTIARRALTLRCPRCGETRLFHGWFRMARECALCGLLFERAQGYFVGAIYINYAVTTLIAVGGFFVLWGLLGLSTRAQLLVLVPIVLVFPLWFFRYSRSLWLALEWSLNQEI